MAKEKKIGIKYYLNTKLNPILDEDGQERFPVYVTVIYATKNTKFLYPHFFASEVVNENNINVLPSRNKDNYLNEYEFEKLFIDRTHHITNQDINEFESAVNQIITFENSILKEEFNLKGLSNRLYTYRLPFVKRASRVLKDELKLIVSSFLEKDFENLAFSSDWSFEQSYFCLKEFHPNKIKDWIPNEFRLKVIAYLEVQRFNFKSVGFPELRTLDLMSSSFLSKFSFNLILNREKHLFSDDNILSELSEDFQFDRKHTAYINNALKGLVIKSG